LQNSNLAHVTNQAR